MTLALVEAESTYHVINLVDPNSIIRVSIPVGKQPELVGLDVSKLPGRSRWHERVRREGIPLASPPITLTTGRPGLVLWHPVVTLGQPAEEVEMIAGALHLDTVLEYAVNETAPDESAIIVAIDDKEVLRSGTPAPKDAFSTADISAVVESEMLSRKLNVTAMPIENGNMHKFARNNRSRFVNNSLISLSATAVVFLAVVLLLRVLKTELRLRNKQRRLSLIVEGANLGTWDWNIATGDLALNDRWFQMLGYEPDELPPLIETWENTIHPDDKKRVMAALQDHMLDKTDFYRTEHRVRTKDGSWCWVLDAGKITDYNRRGEPIRASGIHADLTEMKAAEEALRETEEQYKNIFDNIMDGFYRADMQGRLLLVNPSAASMLGYDSPDEILGLDIAATFYIDPDNRAAFLQQLMRTGYIFSFRAPLKKKDGSHMYAETNTRLLLDEDQKPCGVEGVFRDITEQIRMEKSLITAKEQAEAADQAKSEFLANMSHEIRTPLNGLLGMLQLLKTSQLNKEQSGYVDTAVKSGRGLLSILNDLLSLSQMEAGVIHIQAEPFAIRETLETVIKTFHPQADVKNVRLRTLVEPSVPDVLVADEGRIRQILFNVIGNALKFTDKGSVEVRLHMPEHSFARGDKLLLVEVEDTGIGIPDEKIADCFNAFAQVDGSYSRNFGGAGLGLRIVKRLVDLMRGTISVSTKQGRGTTFAFTVRTAVGKPDQLIEQQSTDDDRSEAVTPLRILLVEDNKTNRDAAAFMLEKLGHTVVCAENGREALQRLENKPFDCVLMDVQMPVMDGLEAVKHIRSSNAPYRDIPVAALTAHALSGDKEAFLTAGMDEYIEKPIDFDKLTAVLSRFAERLENR